MASGVRLKYEDVKKYIEDNGNGIILLSKTYKNNREKLEMQCPCGNIFYMSFDNFKKGQRCPKCGIKKRAKTQAHDYNYVKQMFEDNGYELVSEEYKNAFGKLEAYCPKHGNFTTTFSDVRQGGGCVHCGIERRIEKLKHDIEYVRNFMAQNGDVLLSDIYINNLQKLKIQCPQGHIYEMSFGNYVMNHRCPYCHIYKGEERIKTFLDTTDYEYIHNKGCFSDLKGKGGGLLRPDFIIEELKLWIEYDGEQHFKPISFNGEDEQTTLSNFEKGKIHDEIKNTYAKEHGYTMVRIPYWDYENIEKILKPYFI